MGKANNIILGGDYVGLSCLFGHKWNGCKCGKCGCSRDEEHRWQGVRCSVCGKTRTINEITDPAALSYIANNNSNIFIRIEAATKLNDKALVLHLNEIRIATLAKNTNDWDNHYAVKKLTNQTLLVDVAINAVSLVASKFAVMKLTSQAALIDVAKNSKYVEVRALAVEKITDQAFLAAIIKSSKGIVQNRGGAANTDKYFEVRKAAVKHLTDKILIADVLENAEYPNIRSYYYCDTLVERLNAKI